MQLTLSGAGGKAKNPVEGKALTNLNTFDCPDDCHRQSSKSCTCTADRGQSRPQQDLFCSFRLGICKSSRRRGGAPVWLSGNAAIVRDCQMMRRRGPSRRTGWLHSFPGDRDSLTMSSALRPGPGSIAANEKEWPVTGVRPQDVASSLLRLRCSLSRVAHSH
jgi:hypothetical protein